jgi:hypothetical protein
MNARPEGYCHFLSTMTERVTVDSLSETGETQPSANLTCQEFKSTRQFVPEHCQRGLNTVALSMLGCCMARCLQPKHRNAVTLVTSLQNMSECLTDVSHLS